MLLVPRLPSQQLKGFRAVHHQLSIQVCVLHTAYSVHKIKFWSSLKKAGEQQWKREGKRGDYW